MKRFKNILYVADGVTEREPALLRAVELARMNEARLTVVDVLDLPEELPDYIVDSVGDPKKDLINRRKRELDCLISPYGSQKVIIYTQVLVGPPFVEVIRAVQRNHFDLVIKAPRPPKGIYGTTLGSIDMHLLRKCPCPVWIEKTAKAFRYRTVLAAIDPMADKKDNCCRLVMDVATSMATLKEASMAVVHAWSLYGETALSSPWLHKTPEQVDALKQQERERHEEKMDEVLAHYDMSCQDEHVFLVQGHATEAILSTDHRLQSDLIVMGTVGRTGIPGFIIGNTAETVLQTTPASILAVKPEGFVSPVS